MISRVMRSRKAQRWLWRWAEYLAFENWNRDVRYDPKLRHSDWHDIWVALRNANVAEIPVGTRR